MARRSVRGDESVVEVDKPPRAVELCANRMPFRIAHIILDIEL